MSDFDPDRFRAQLDDVAQELAELRRMDLPSRLLDIEDRLEQRVGLLRQLGDEWAGLIAPVSRAGGLRGLNAGVDALSQRVHRLTLAVAGLVVLTVVLGVLVLVG